MERYCVFWNVQRLFDPSGMPVGRTIEGEGASRSVEAYRRKVQNVASCLRAATGGEVPAVLAFAEVESVRVLSDIRDATGWNELTIVDEQVPDRTIDGLDVALMFDRTLFDVKSLRARSIALDNRFATRDLLDVRLVHAASGRDVMFSVAHWPSRLIGEGVALRFAYSVYLRRLVTSVLKFPKSDIVRADGTVVMPNERELIERWNTPCMLMGDFNDEPYDKSIREALDSTRFEKLVLKRAALKGKALVKIGNYLDASPPLYNPCWYLKFSRSSEDAGTYYRSEWRTYDQLLLSHGALNPGSPVHYVQNSACVFRSRDNLGTQDEPIAMTTRSGYPKAYKKTVEDGVSDHFPLLYKIHLEE